MDKTINNCIYVVLIIGMLLSGLTNVVSAESSTPKFLALPFTDLNVKLQQGWYYDFSTEAHEGIDYIKNWKTFDVKASADGQAYYAKSSSWGNYVKIKHVVGTDTYYTLYAHLASSPLKANKWIPVTRGQYIGAAGKTGKANNVIHLHFELSKDDVGKGHRLDPYDIYSTKKNYPPSKPNGPNHFWGNTPTNPEPVSIQYQGHFANKGWINWVKDGQTSQASGNQMEAIKIKTSNYGVTYAVHIADYGWLKEVSDGAQAGTTGKGKSLQAIKIELHDDPSNMHVNYRVFVNGAWQGWVSDGQVAGTVGKNLPVTKIEIKVSTS